MGNAIPIKRNIIDHRNIISMEIHKTEMMDLPDELVNMIAMNLQPKDYGNFANTNKDIKKALLDPTNISLTRSTWFSYHIAHNILKGNNTFITGPGGCGKSYTIGVLVKLALERNLRVALTATTGMAVCNLISQTSHIPDIKNVYIGTIHAFAGFNLTMLSTNLFSFTQRVNVATPNIKRWNETDILIIDEVSMLTALLLEKLNKVARRSRGNRLPFGGMKVVFVGDFHQLPPVGGKFPFKSDVWGKMNIKTYPLLQPVRQMNDLEFFHLLMRIRTGRYKEKDLKDLNTRIIKDLPDTATRLYFSNKSADTYNQIRFKALETKTVYMHNSLIEILRRKRDPITGVYSYEPYIKPLTDQHKKVLEKYSSRYCPSTLQLKIGALYIITKNIDVPRGLVNGTKVVCTENGTLGFALQSDTDTLGLNGDIPIMGFLTSLGGDIYASIKQYPLRLGYAVTIHSSQGMTLNKAVLDMSEAVGSLRALAYVALSRVHSLDELYLLHPLTEKVVVSDANARKYYKHAK